MTPMSRVRVVYEGDATAARVELVTVGDDGAELSVADIPANQLMLFVDKNRPGSSSLVLRIDAQFVTLIAEGKVDDLARQRMEHLASLGRSPDDVETAKLCAHHYRIGECPYGCVEDTADIDDANVADMRREHEAAPLPPAQSAKKKKR